MNQSTPDTAVRIAMWSGPRNISTAMMRSFENRPDAAVWDEPLYGPYLHETGLPHPMAAEIVAAQGSDWRPIVARLFGPVPNEKPIFYQKHMAHHLLPTMDRNWVTDVRLRHCFLIRDPRLVLASYANKRGGDVISAADLGFEQQLEIFHRVADTTGKPPPVLESADVLKNPKGMLGALCHAVGIEFDEAMLRWPPGRRDSDGVWSEHWYDSVWRSEGFAPYVERKATLTQALTPVADQCRAAYEELFERRLRAV